MNHQIKRAVAFALATSAAAGGAQASLLSTAVAAGNVVYASGSTAVAATLANYFDQVLDNTQNPCAVSSSSSSSALEIYTDTGSGQAFVAYACMSNTAVISGSSVPIAFVKENNAGSGNALLPVGSAYASNQLSFPALSSLNCGTPTGKATSTAVVNGSSVPVGAAYSAFTCSGVTTASVSPNMGFADVDPALFGASASSYGVKDGPTIDLVFAPAVSLGLYHALQSAQGLTQDDALADVPSLTHGELNTIFTGQVTDWQYFSGYTGSAAQAVGSVAVTFGNSGTSTLGSYEGKTSLPSTTTIHICRRDDYSGTEKTMETALGGLANNGGSCLSGVNNWVSSTNSELLGSGWANSATSSTVYANSSTGNLLKCLEANDAVGQFAIGYASVDNAWGTNGTPAQSSLAADFRYIKVDGALPSIENAASGRYSIFAQSVYTIPANSSQPNSLSGGAALALQNAITGTHGLGYYKVVEAVNALDQWSNPTFHGGLLAIPSGAGTGPNTPVGVSATNAQFFVDPVNMYYHTTGSVDTAANPSAIDNCQPANVANINLTANTPVGGIAAFTPSGN
jgi:hypothetical protein